jgi:trans-aconitate methyltransferase
VNARDAAALIHDAVPRAPGTWADLGAGEGTFTRALADRLEPPSTVIAVDQDASALAALARRVKVDGVRVTPVTGDFTQPSEWAPADAAPLDGILLANALHYVTDTEAVLARLVGRMRTGGRLVLIEYDRRGPNPWVPHPIPIARWPSLAAATGLTALAITARRPSAFGGDLYVAVADRA